MGKGLINMFRKVILLSIFVFLFFGLALADNTCSPNKLPELLIFYSESCHSCAAVKKEVMPEIESEFYGKIVVTYLNIADLDNYKKLISLQQEYGDKASNAIPVAYFQKNMLFGELSIRSRLRNIINDYLKADKSANSALELGNLDLAAYFANFKPLVIIGAGLIDGVNPCAFTVIVFFISFLALQGYRRRELIVIGLLFIFSVFFTYLLIGLGIFNFLYRMEEFLFISRFFNIAIGVLSIVLGFMAVYDLVKFRRTGETAGLLLQLPQVIKKRIHAVIGDHYRIKDKTKGAPNKRSLIFLGASALSTGFLVSVLESICTGQTYLPTIVFILKTKGQLRALWYLLIYNFMFIVPLFIIFVLALTGATSEHFSKFLKKHMLTVKFLMAVLFFGLGTFLIWRG